jgi:hypothetical protein
MFRDRFLGDRLNELKASFRINCSVLAAKDESRGPEDERFLLVAVRLWCWGRGDIGFAPKPNQDSRHPIRTFLKFSPYEIVTVIWKQSILIVQKYASSLIWISA